MENPANVTQLQRQLPDEVALPQELKMLTPNELRLLKAMTGKPLEDLVGDGADEADQMQMGIWLEAQGGKGFRRELGGGRRRPATECPEPELSDPSPTDTSPASPGSVTSGG